MGLSIIPAKLEIFLYQFAPSWVPLGGVSGVWTDLFPPAVTVVKSYTKTDVIFLDLETDETAEFSPGGLDAPEILDCH